LCKRGNKKVSDGEKMCVARPLVVGPTVCVVLGLKKQSGTGQVQSVITQGCTLIQAITGKCGIKIILSLFCVRVGGAGVSSSGTSDKPLSLVLPVVAKQEVADKVSN
jgi:hypothetical protein